MQVMQEGKDRYIFVVEPTNDFDPRFWGLYRSTNDGLLEEEQLNDLLNVGVMDILTSAFPTIANTGSTPGGVYG